MKPTDLDDLAPPEPDATTRERVGARTRALHRRRVGVRFAGAGSAVVVVALVAALAWPNSGSNSRIIVPATTPRTTVAEPLRPPRLGVVGRWRPLSITGFGGVLVARAILDFQTTSYFDASDGCNSLTGDYRLGVNGDFQILPRAGGETQMACVGYHGAPDPVPVPNGTVVLATKRVAFSGDNLVMLDADGHELARYAPVQKACTLEGFSASTSLPMPTPETLRVPRVYLGYLHLDPPSAGATPKFSAAAIWRPSLMPFASESHFEIVLASYSSKRPSTGTSNGYYPAPKLAWVVIGEDVPLIVWGTAGKMSCGTTLKIYDATTGQAIGDESFQTPTG